MADQNTEQQKQQAEAAKQQAEAAKKRVQEEAAAREKARSERNTEESKWKPTPTQEECDLAALGVHVLDKEPDGSPEQPQRPIEQQRHMQADSRGGYATRQAAPAPKPPTP